MSDQPLVEGSWDRAHALIDLGRYAEAAAELRRLIASAPAEPTYAAWLAMCLVEEDPEQAEVEASRAISLDPRSSLGLEALARARWAREDRRGAFEAATTLTELTPHDPRALALLATCAALHGKHRTAKRAADAALELAPNDPVVWTARGHTALARSRFTSAEADARRALELDSQHAPAYELLSFALIARGKLEESIDVAEGLSHVEPGRPEALRAAQTAAGSAVLIALPLGFTVGRVVAAATRPAVGPIPAVVMGIGTTIVLFRTAQRLVDRCLERNDPRTALRKLRRATRLTIGGFFGALALFLGGVWLMEEVVQREPEVPEPAGNVEYEQQGTTATPFDLGDGSVTPGMAVEALVPGASPIELVDSGDRDGAWGLVAYSVESQGVACSALTLLDGTTWTVLDPVCVDDDLEVTAAKEVELDSGSAVIGVAARDVVGLSVRGSDVELRRRVMPQSGVAPRARFVVFLPDQHDDPILEYREDGTSSAVAVAP